MTPTQSETPDDHPRTKALLEEIKALRYSAANDRATDLCWALETDLTAERAARQRAERERDAVREGFRQMMASRQEYSDAAVAAEAARLEREEYWKQKCESAWQRGDEQGQQVVKLCLEKSDLERALAEARRDAERYALLRQWLIDPELRIAHLFSVQTDVDVDTAVDTALAGRGERDAG